MRCLLSSFLALMSPPQRTFLWPAYLKWFSPCQLSQNSQSSNLFLFMQGSWRLDLTRYRFLSVFPLSHSSDSPTLVKLFLKGSNSSFRLCRLYNLCDDYSVCHCGTTDNLSIGWVWLCSTETVITKIGIALEIVCRPEFADTPDLEKKSHETIVFLVSHNIPIV